MTDWQKTKPRPSRVKQALDSGFARWLQRTLVTAMLGTLIGSLITHHNWDDLIVACLLALAIIFEIPEPRR